MLEEHDLAPDRDGTVARTITGPVHELADERVPDDVGAHEVSPARLPDVDWTEETRVAAADAATAAGVGETVVVVVISLHFVAARAAGGSDGSGGGSVGGGRV
ncbi:hypothetical protein DM860_009191 [Cuscuta australis]|uniref:Uncharacterized protein n=1 Tax=Cuscuta australis TaxID=267555 RepID=A0A328DB36_9ASTE|nr:hypothetical protein DM860_009191 [Cuscuta australis]